MIRRSLVSFILISLIINNLGCWDYHDLESLTVPFIAAFDLSTDETDDTFLLSTLSPNLDRDTKGKVQVIPITVRRAGEYRGNHAYYTPEMYNPGILRVLLLGENFVRSGQYKSLSDSSKRSPLISNTASLAVAEGKALKLLEQRPEDYPDIGGFIIRQLSSEQKHSFLPTINLNKFLTNTVTGRNPILPVIKPRKDVAMLSGVAIFNKFKMVDKIDTNESKTLAFLRGIKGMGSLNYEVKKDGEIVDLGSLMLVNSRKVKVSRKDDHYYFDISVTLKGGLVESFYYTNLTKNPECLKEIEQSVEADVSRDAYRFINKMQAEYGFDCLDINRYALAKWRKELKDIIDDPKFIKNATIRVKVTVKIKNTGDAS